MSHDYYTQTPGETDTLSRIMQLGFDKRVKLDRNVPFSAFFGNTENGSEKKFSDVATDIEIEITKGNESISALSVRGQASTLGPLNKRKQGVNSQIQTRSFPIIRDNGALTAEDGFTRAIGELPVRGTVTSSMQKRLRALAFKFFRKEAVGQVYKSEELARDSLIFGTMEYNPTGDRFDWFRNSDNNINVPTVWSDSGADPFLDIAGACDVVRINGREMPDFCGMDNTAFFNFISHPDTKAFADNRRYEITMVGKDMMPPKRYARHIKAGWDPRAFIITPQGYPLWIFTTNAFYTKDDESTEFYMPTDKVFVTSTQARMDDYYGPSDTLPEEYAIASLKKKFLGIANAATTSALDGTNSIIDPRMFHFEAMGTLNNKSISLELNCAPIHAPTNTDAVAVLNGVTV